MSAVAIMPPPMKPILLLSVADVLIARTVLATRVARQKIVPTAPARASASSVGSVGDDDSARDRNLNCCEWLCTTKMNDHEKYGPPSPESRNQSQASGLMRGTVRESPRAHGASRTLPENDVTAPTEAREDQDEERAGLRLRVFPFRPEVTTAQHDVGGGSHAARPQGSALRQGQLKQGTVDPSANRRRLRRIFGVLHEVLASSLCFYVYRP